METKGRAFYYDVAVEWKGEKKAMASCEGKPEFEVATPPEFKGHAGIWSPEDLFVEAVNACVMTTFLALAERAGLRLLAYRSEAQGRLERGDSGFAFSRIEVRPTLRVESDDDIALAEKTLADAERHCLISHSITSDVHIVPSITKGDA